MVNGGMVTEGPGTRGGVPPPLCHVDDCCILVALVGLTVLGTPGVDKEAEEKSINVLEIGRSQQ